MEKKKCSKCNIDQELFEFTRIKKTGNFDPTCKNCKKKLNQNRELDKLRKKLPEKLQTGWWDEMGKG